MSLISKLATKLRLSLYDKIFTSSVFGYNKKSKSAMDDEFKKGKWDYLEGSEEKERYTNIIQLYNKQKPQGTLLDVGCAQGVLYQSFKEDSAGFFQKYYGIDISEEAIRIAKNKFPEANFNMLNLETKKLHNKFDVIVFNETLYYFNWPMKTLQKCVAENLNDGGIFIVSMFNYLGRNDRIWKSITNEYAIIDEATAVNNKNQRWDAKVFSTKK